MADYNADIIGFPKSWCKHGPDCKDCLPKLSHTPPIVIGVDPGKAGAIAAVSAIGIACIWKMPLIKGKGKSEYDLQIIVNEIVQPYSTNAVFFIEKTQPMPPKFGGGISNFHRGVGRGWEWMLAGLRIPYYLVSPKTWQKEMLRDVEGKDTKQKSLIQAKRLFPDIQIGKHHGSSDSLLIAEYGRRQLKTL